MNIYLSSAGLRNIIILVSQSIHPHPHPDPITWLASIKALPLTCRFNSKYDICDNNFLPFHYTLTLIDESINNMLYLNVVFSNFYKWINIICLLWLFSLFQNHFFYIHSYYACDFSPFTFTVLKQFVWIRHNSSIFSIVNRHF